MSGVRSFLGERNVSNLNLDQLTGERFVAEQLYGRLANIVDDISSRHLHDTSAFKRIVGGDPITTDRKYRDLITFRPFARLLFSANEYPQSTDASSGFYDRWLLISFPNEFRGQPDEVPRHILDARLARPEELSGVLNRALAAMPGVLGQRLRSTPSMRLASDEFRNATDWVVVWLERMLVEQSTGAIERTVIHQALVNEAHRQQRAVLSATALYKKIRQHWPRVSEAQLRIDPARNGVECFVGLDWRRGVPPF